MGDAENLYGKYYKVEDERPKAWYHGKNLAPELSTNTNPCDVYYTARCHLAEQAITLGSGAQEGFEEDGNFRFLAGSRAKIIAFLKSLPGAHVVVRNYNTSTQTVWQSAIVWDNGAAYYSDPISDADPEVVVAEESDCMVDEFDDDDDEDDVLGNRYEDPAAASDEFMTLAFVTRDHHEMELVNGLVKESLAPVRIMVHKRPGTAYVLANVPMRGLQLIAMGIAGEKLIRENYTPDVIVGFDQAVEDIVSETPRGRLVILEGEPGCGKTHMVQALMKTAGQARFVIVPPKLLKDLEDPGFILTFIQENMTGSSHMPLVLVLEDADQCLTERNMENISSISAILNLSDGIVGKLLNLRIVATTNTPVGKGKDGKKTQVFDKAALRKGRLSAHIKVGPLDNDHANAVFQRLTSTELVKYKSETNIPLGDVYDAANEWLEKNQEKVTEKMVADLKKKK